jgi:hypothetical protein
MALEFFTKFPEFKDMIPEWRTVETRAKEGESSVVIHTRRFRKHNGSEFDKDDEWPACPNIIDQEGLISAGPGYGPLEVGQTMPSLDPQDDLLGIEYLEWL